MVIKDITEIGRGTSAKDGLAAVRERLSLIEGIAHDEERAHGAQDQLLVEVLCAIQRGYRWPKSLAREALKVTEIEFSRWYA